MELGIKDYYLIVKKRFLMIAVSVLLLTIATYLVSAFLMTPEYEASTKLIVVKTDNNIQSANNINMDAVNTNIRLIDTYKEVIKTPRIINSVLKKHPEFELKYNDLVNKIKVSSVNNTQVMTVAVTDGSYNKAMNMVNAISLEFQEQIPTIMNVDNVSLLNEAEPMDSPTPVAPRPILNTAVAFVLTLMLTIGLAFLLDYLDDTIKSEDDVTKYLGLPTLALIARIQQDDLVDKKRSDDTDEVVKKADSKVGQANATTQKAKGGAR